MPPPPLAATQDYSTTRYNPEQLAQMLGPIALYPDPLLSEVLAACTYPQDVAALGLYLQTDATPTPDEVNAQTWDVSVKALANYPNVVNMMNSQMDWTNSVGIAFTNQPTDVMACAAALPSAGGQNLVTTPQQEMSPAAASFRSSCAARCHLRAGLRPGGHLLQPRRLLHLRQSLRGQPIFQSLLRLDPPEFRPLRELGHDWRRPVFVNTGIGTTIADARFRCRCGRSCRAAA